MYQEPSSHSISAATGAMSGAGGRYEKRLRDLDGLYLDTKAYEAALSQEADKVIYAVDEQRPVQASGDLIFGTTFMEPGRIGDEFYMTRGHIHARANRPEVYYGEHGIGLMILETPEGDVRLLEIAPRVAVYVPPYWIHRSINVGTTPLVMSFFYPSDSGQDYSIIEQSGGMAVRVIADGAGWKAVPNPGYRPRSAQQIAAVLKSAD